MQSLVFLLLVIIIILALSSVPRLGIHCAPTLAGVYWSECWLVVWRRLATTFPSEQLWLHMQLNATCTTE